MMKWDYYSKRRNISLIDFIKVRDIGSYEDLTKTLSGMDISSPALGMFQSAYAIAFPPIPKVQKPAPKPKLPPVLKATAPKKKLPPSKKTSRGK